MKKGSTQKASKSRKSRSKKQIQDVQHDAFDLGSLFEYSRIINSSLDLPFILGNVLLTIMGKLLVSRALVLLRHGEGRYRIDSAKGLPQEVLGREFQLENAQISTLGIGVLPQENTPLGVFLRHYEFETVLPVTSRSVQFGMIAIGHRVRGPKYSKKEREFLESLVNLSATAMEKGLVIEELRQVNRTLDQKIQELNTLFELSKEFNASLERETIIKTLLFALMGQIGVRRYCVFLRDGEDMKTVINRSMTEIVNDEFFKALNLITQASSVSELPSEHEIVRNELERLQMKIIVPMMIQNTTSGILCLGEKIGGGEYTQSDREFLYSVGSLAMISLENVRLFIEALEKQKMEDELNIAREIQRGLLPTTLPKIPDYEIVAVNVSSKQVGGDTYDVIQLSPTKFVIAIGDVSGKGTPAALLMANVQATLRALVSIDLPLPELTKRMNNLIFNSTSTDRFITFFWGILDTQKNTFTTINAGHNPPYMVSRDGIFSRLEKGGIILGVLPTFVAYEEEITGINPGDLIVLFTDGVSEAMNAEGREFGEERIERVLQNYYPESVEKILFQLQTSVREYILGAPQSDDITLLLLKRKKMH
jgi:sigma-B regulation protein RsbU (phosphoserine phosphatase)